MSPALNGSSTLERFERSNVSKIRNGIMFDFYPGLPHTYNHGFAFATFNDVTSWGGATTPINDIIEANL